MRPELRSLVAVGAGERFGQGQQGVEEVLLLRCGCGRNGEERQNDERAGDRVIQNAEFRMQKGMFFHDTRFLHSAFCILHYVNA
jgi:hypothetical protein